MIEHGIQLDHLREARIGFDEAIYRGRQERRRRSRRSSRTPSRRARGVSSRACEAGEVRTPSRAPHREALDYDAVSRTAFLGKRPRAGSVAAPRRGPHRPAAPTWR